MKRLVPAQRRSRDEDERAEPDRRALEQASPKRAPAADPGTARILALQRGAGNQAVARMLAGAGTEDAALARQKAPEASKEDQKKAIDDALTAEDFDTYVQLLTKMDRKFVKDHLLSANQEQLRRIDDAAKRAGLPASGRVRENVRWHLGKWYGVKPKRQKTGYGFGDLKVRFGAISNGSVKAGTNYKFPVDITFKPDKDLVDADEIAFVQRVRLVDTATGENKDWDETNKKRATDRNSSIDRLAGRKYGWYGYKDDEGESGTVKPWKKDKPDTAAWMHDTPQADIASTTWEFETAVMARSGSDEGLVYATCTWGFTVDAKLRVTAMNVLFFNKPTKDFMKAVEKWNEQADDPDAGDRNAPDQQKLPTPT
jgi:hypothetical protein